MSDHIGRHARIAAGLIAAVVALVPVAPAGAAAVPRQTLFVVAADEEAGLLAARLEALGSDQSGQIERIQVVATEEEFAQVLLAVTDVNRFREAEGLAPVALVDLRPAASAVGASVVGGPEGGHPGGARRHQCQCCWAAATL